MDALHRFLRPAHALLLLLLCLASCSRLTQQKMPAEVPALLRQTVESGTLPAALRHRKERAKAFAELKDFYRKRGYQPAWSDVRGPLPRAQELVDAIGGLAVEALDPRQYDREGLARLLREAE